MNRIALLALALLAPRLQSVAAQPVTPPPLDTAAAATDTTPIAQQGRTQSASNPIRSGLFGRGDAYLAAGFAFAAAALFPFDLHIAEEFQSPAAQGNRGLNDAATRLEKLTSPGAYYIGGGLYLLGRMSGRHRIADLGLHATEAMVLAEGIGYVLKRTVGRARPYVSDTQDPRDFSFGTGFGTGDRRSLPSGHTYTAFAVASAVTSEVGEWWPGRTWLVAPVMYGGAAMVGLSRMYHNQHWVSDIVLGAAVGTFSGLKLVRYMHGNPGNAADRLLLGAPVARRSENGTQLGWRIEF